VLFPHAAPAPGGVLHVQFDQSSFNRHARAMITNTLRGVTTLLSRAELTPTAIDQVVLAGGSTTMPALREAVGELTRPVATADENHIARGALRHAHELGRRPAPSYDEPTPEPKPRQAEQVPANQLTATVLTAPAHATDPPLNAIRHLISTGQTDAAKTELRTLITEAESLLAELEATKQEPDNAATAGDLIATARKWLENGNHRNAIAVAHMAWRKNLHDVDVFEEMLDLHCTAAMANPTPANFEADKGWLVCALHHDPTNGHIRELLAERNYLQGKALLRTTNREEARQALQAALKWSPDHAKATAALRELSQRRAP
jgi:Hsp70 protein